MNIQRRYLIIYISGFLSYTQKRCDLRGGGGGGRETETERQRQTDRKTMGKSDRDGGRERIGESIL